MLGHPSIRSVGASVKAAGSHASSVVLQRSPLDLDLHRGLRDVRAHRVRSRAYNRWAVESESAIAAASEPLCSLPIVGETTVEDVVFYAAVGAVAMFGWVPFPTAGLIGSVHALHQRARNVTRTGAVGEARKGLIEAVDDVL
jgi:hypothetical protein